MSHHSSPSLLQQIMDGTKLALPRSVAILLMVAGAVGFIVSLLAFEGQVLCLFGSTLVVFVGLFFSMIARRRQTPTVAEDGRDVGWQPAGTGQSAQFDRGIARQTPAPQSWAQPEGRHVMSRREVSRSRVLTTSQPVRAPAGSTTSARSSQAVLAGQVGDVLRRQGALVWIETQNGDRSILKVRTRSGDTFTAIVREGSEIVDVNDVRGLYGLMAAHSSVGAFMVTRGTYTAKAQDWARQRSLTLLEAGQVAEILIE